MEIRDESLRESLTEWVDMHHTSPIDQKQRDLTETILVPNQPELLEDLLVMRDAFDARMKKVFNKKRWRRLDLSNNNDPSLVQFQLYPIGFCAFIRDKLLGTIQSELRNPHMGGLQALRRFMTKGGVFKKVSGAIFKKYFQNGLQAGSLWIDVANNTIDITEPPIKIAPLSESGFEDIDDFELCADLLESYWHYDVYPNTVFPYLAPIYPIIVLTPTGIIQLLRLNETMIAQNVLAGFGLAQDFIFKSRFSGKQLPAQCHHLIGEEFFWDEDVYDFGYGSLHGEVFCRGGASEEMLTEIFETLRRPEVHENLARLIDEATDHVESFNQLGLRTRRTLNHRHRHSATEAGTRCKFSSR